MSASNAPGQLMVNVDPALLVTYATLVARGHSPFHGGTPDRPWLNDRLQTEPLSRALIERRFPRTSPQEIAAVETELLADAEASGFSRRVDWAPGFSAAHQPPLYDFLVGSVARVLGATHPCAVLRVGRGHSQ